MSTGFTYGQQLDYSDWEEVDRILNLAERDFNARDPAGFQINLELVADETTSEGDTRLYEIQGVEEDYDNTMEVSRLGGECLKFDSYSPFDKVFHEYGESIGRVMRTSPRDWP